MRSQFASGAPAPRHPFRQTLAPARNTERLRNEDGDLKLFVLSFTAFFICIYSFIF
ncbi:hypothetical protein [Sphingomonas alpina]|uniref:Uncharacterized protein n=1 Tax=Sphingomonas alpina TaxID=653931 RepID=A0A7H0LL23_9SPHN|nr:hypothetical protein [Sphingomonas alpina]QNQ10376.1 hypothetical protein H3Z74_03850 [Sphingomonas alpina]